MAGAWLCSAYSEKAALSGQAAETEHGPQRWPEAPHLLQTTMGGFGFQIPNTFALLRHSKCIFTQKVSPMAGLRPVLWTGQAATASVTSPDTVSTLCA